MLANLEERVKTGAGGDQGLGTRQWTRKGGIPYASVQGCKGNMFYMIIYFQLTVLFITKFAHIFSIILKNY